MPWTQEQQRKPRKGTRRSKGSLSRSFFHRMAAKNRLGSIKEGTDEDHSGEQPIPNQIKRGKRSERPFLVLEAKRELLSELKRAGGDSSGPEFEEKLQTLLTSYEPSHFDPRRRVTKKSVDSCSRCLDPSKLEGVGISESKPVYPGCFGMNGKGEPMYKLGRMAFDMFRPTQLIVSIQGTFNFIDIVDGTDEKAVKYVPNSLLADVRHGKRAQFGNIISSQHSQSNLGFRSLAKTPQTK
jgi:hypothetical protein